MSIENEIKQIKDSYNDSIIAKAKAEERRKTALEQKKQIEKQCQDLGFAPEKLGEIKKEKYDMILKEIAKAKAALNITDSEDNGDMPF